MTHAAHGNLDAAAGEVLSRYALSGTTLVPVQGGFSGARLWRFTTAAGDFCLRAWPVGQESHRLQHIHDLVQVAGALMGPLIPAIVATTSAATWVDHAGRLWEVTTWVPGQADFHASPSHARIQAACAALGALHAAWRQEWVYPGTCPALYRRLEAAREWVSMLDSGWRPKRTLTSVDPVWNWTDRAWRQVANRIRKLPNQLGPWLGRCLPLQPCLCDIWHDHVLFTGDLVTGLIDFGSVKIDHVAVDLARLLGSLVGDDAGMRRAGLDAYRQFHPFTLEEEALVQLLDETGTIVALANWLKWLYREGLSFDNRAAVARRLATLVERVEAWEQ